jgi:hypothetical protein
MSLETSDIRIGTSYYQDTGCEVSQRCTRCPLPKCKHDLTEEKQETARNQERNMLIRKVSAAGASPQQIAEVSGMSTRTVHRILSRKG